MFKKTIVVLLMFSTALSSCGKKTEIIRETPVPAETSAPATVVTPAETPVSVATPASVETFTPSPILRASLVAFYVFLLRCAGDSFSAFAVEEEKRHGFIASTKDYDVPPYLQSYAAAVLADYTFGAYNSFKVRFFKKAVPAKKS